MKINGPNHSNFNPYKKNIQNQQQASETTAKKDKIEISNEAKQMQEHQKAQETRKKHVEALKQKVDAGEYQVDAKQTAEKMINFWKNR
ncbi:flagellar biosynthesis anti-sigma factor FlgM [Pontibacillus salipaludis]|uniref:flagellar biosynthesis anti-sigma factor FlgM n=1 Tax=Pontibacillus salipaludis TaxID=1697394 RepID=UPI0031ECF347